MTAFFPPYVGFDRIWDGDPIGLLQKILVPEPIPKIIPPDAVHDDPPNSGLLASA
jgi:hypothetical protein